jgi:hypothetical protein
MSPLRKLIGGITLTYLFLLLTNYCFFESIFANRGYMTLARGFILTFYALLFLFRYFNLDNSEVERYWRPLLWITAGLAIFYPVVSISLAFQEYLVKRTPGDQPRIYQLIPQVMSIFMYSCFTYAFYLCRKIK